MFSQLIYQQLALKYGLDKAMGGEIVKEFLEGAGVNLERFSKYRRSSKQVVRKAKIKQHGGEVSIPVWQTNKQLRKSIKQEIESGKFLMGDAIAPREYKKYKLGIDGTIHLETFTVTGRHIPLHELRERLYQEHSEKGLIREHSDDHYAMLSYQDTVKRLK